MRRAERSRSRRHFEYGLAGRGALRPALKIIGVDGSTTTADVAELQLLIEGAAAVEVDIVIADGRSTELER